MTKDDEIKLLRQALKDACYWVSYEEGQYPSDYMRWYKDKIDINSYNLIKQIENEIENE